MSDTTQEFFAEIDAHKAAKEAKEAKELADMFYQPSVCRQCGAQVVFLEQHKLFHDGVRRWMKDFAKNVSDELERISERVTDTRAWIADLEKRQGGAHE